jgi:hypothetical protein
MAQTAAVVTWPQVTRLTVSGSKNRQARGACYLDSALSTSGRVAFSTTWRNVTRPREMRLLVHKPEFRLTPN